jgi:hypothetical protein
MFKKQEFFQIYPEVPLFQFIKKKGAMKLLKIWLSIIIDKHEF